MFSNAKKLIIWVKNRGVQKQRVSEKHFFVHLNNNYFDEKQGVSENKGCPKT